ncbi:MAG: AsmA family protein [Halieaceae bacterium]
MLVILWILGGLVALVVLAMLVVPMFIDEQALIEMAQEQVRASTGGELMVEGETELSLFPRFGLRLENTSLDLPARSDYDQQINASIKELDVGLSLLPLLSGNVDVGTIVISGVTADITEPQALPPAPEPQPIMSDREWEKRGKQIRENKSQERQRQLAEDAAVVAVAIVAEAVRIEDITLILRTRDGSLSNQIKIDALTLSGVNTSNELMALEGVMTVLGDGSTQPLGITLDGGIRVASDFSKIQLDNLSAEVTGALTQPVTSTLNGEFLMKPAKADFKLDATLPGGDVTGQLVWSALESPEIKVNVSTARLDVDQIQPAAAPAGNASAPTKSAAPSPSQAGQSPPPVPLPVGPLRDLDLELRVTANQLIAAGQSITDAQVLMRVLDGIANIEYIRGVLHEGQLDTRIALNARRPIVEAEVEGGLKGVNMDLLLGSLGNQDAASGRIEMGWDLTTQGETSEDLVAALDGDVSAGGQDLVIKKVSIQALVCSAVAAVNKIPPITGLPNNTPITDLSLAIDFDDGAGDIEKLRFATPGVEMKGSGDVDLKTLDFGFRLEGQVNNDIMQVSSLCVIDQRYSGVDWPLDCSGNLASESGANCKLDVASIAQQIIENEAKQQIQDAVEEKAGSFIKKIFGG